MKRGNLLLVCILFLFVVGMANAQIGIGTDNPHSSALLDIRSIGSIGNKGLLIPRMDLGDLTSADPVYDPMESLLVYNTDLANTANNKVKAGYYYWHNNAWTPINGLGLSKYSTTREGTKIGKKWTRGEDIFEIVKTGTAAGVVTTTTTTTGVTTTTISAVLTLNGAIADLSKVIDIRVLSRAIDSNVIYNSASYNVVGDVATVTVNYGGVNATIPSGDYDVIIQYLKQTVINEIE